MDPEKVGFAHSTFEEKTERKSFCWLLVHLQPPLSKELGHGTVGLVSCLTKTRVSSTLHPVQPKTWRNKERMV